MRGKRILRFLKVTGIVSIVVLSVIFAGMMTTWFSIRPPDINNLKDCEGLIVTDKYGSELQISFSTADTRNIIVEIEKVPAHVIQAFIAAEDERFFQHHGFDPIAIFRALTTNMTAGKIVSGASTITQQLVRLVEPHEKTYFQKYLEIVKSIRLEQNVTKEKILECYLNFVPQGNTIVGIQLAARVYFGKDIWNVNVAEAALLASLPKAPGLLNPYGKNRARLFERKDWVLGRMYESGFLTKTEYEWNMNSPIEIQDKDFPFQAPHFLHYVLSQTEQNAGMVKTTLDLSMQKNIEKIVYSHRKRLQYRGADQISCLVIDNRTMEVLVYVGSISFSASYSGYNDGVQALRSPGSTLKPFLYALALENGFNAASILDDTARGYAAPKGEYIPMNFDKREYGPVTFRKALANSLNLSAIYLLNKIGYPSFYDCLRELKLINYPQYGPDYYGLGLVVGNPEVSLFQLVQAYAMLANGGVLRPIKFFEGDFHNVFEDEAPAHRILSIESTAIIRDILADTGARLLGFGDVPYFSFPFSVALKTGTSTQYRDCWTVGFTDEYTVGVWVGNFDGRSTYGLSGASGAGPIFSEIMELLNREKSGESFQLPNTVERVSVCSYSGKLVSEFCPHSRFEIFKIGQKPKEICSFHQDVDHTHRIPSQYAQWLFDKERKNIPSHYSLTTNNNQDGGKIVFDDPWKEINTSENKGKVMVNQQNRQSQESVNAMKHDDIVVIGSPMQTAMPPTNSEQTNGAGNIDIIYPIQGDRFIYDSRMPDKTIEFRALVTDNSPKVTWYLNGYEYSQTGPPYSVYWKMKKGAYTLIASNSAGFGQSITFNVE